MVPSIPCAEALVEILSLCEQTLTALHPRRARRESNLPADKYCRTRRHSGANFGRKLILLQGGRDQREPAGRKTT